MTGKTQTTLISHPNLHILFSPLSRRLA